MNDNNSIIKKIANLAAQKGSITFSDIDEVLPAEFNLGELDDLISSILETGIPIEDSGHPVKINLKPVNNIKQDIKTKSFDKRLNNIRDRLIKKGQGKGFLTYDDLYRAFPDYLVTADLIDEMVENLKTQNISVVDNHNKNDHKKSLKDEELKKYEKEIESTLDEFFKNYAEDTEEPENKEDVVRLGINDLSHKENSNIEIPTIKLPHLKEVIPVLISENALALKKNYIVDNAETKALKTKQRTDSLISAIEETDNYTSINFLPDDNILKIVGNSGWFNGKRISRNAKLVGDRGEEIVLKHLTQTLSGKEKETITWRSHEGETPGWDIDYTNLNNTLLAIEVKATTDNYFSSIEISDNEWSAALRLEDCYFIYLVTRCGSRHPQIQILQNPYKLRESGKLLVTPLIWKIELIS